MNEPNPYQSPDKQPGTAKGATTAGWVKGLGIAIGIVCAVIVCLFLLVCATCGFLLM